MQQPEAHCQSGNVFLKIMSGVECNNTTMNIDLFLIWYNNTLMVH